MAKILVIDDDPVMLRVITLTLEATGHAVLTYQKARRGLDHVGREHPDLLITDIFMPEVDGLEIVRRAHALQPEMPILAMSGGSSLDQADYLEVAQTFGASSILAKPFRPAELVEMVSQLLEQAKA